ncbi:amidohydrolase [Agaribacterium haliotis]|uniref:amidohydrolase n=1 Tax=Agaribacterium haliotis TaxID=2013869 RepID=UPI000BB568FB|nr:amidohydrolase [Agaribacterium haliotis]
MRLIFTALALLLAACAPKDVPVAVEEVQAVNAADSIYLNGKIYTVDTAQPWVEALAIKDGKFVELGSSEAVLKLKGESTEVVDLNGAFVMPGIIDEHIHPDMGADNYLNLFVSATDSWDEITQKIRSFREANPDKKWLYGGTLNWLADNNGLISGSDKPSNKSVLDEIVADRPIALWDQGAHAMLLNSMALKELGIVKGAVPPPGGIFVTDESGEPTGVIRETAATMVLNALDNYPDELWTEKGMKAFLNEMLSYGVTGMNDAYGTKKNLEAYTLIEKQGQLNQWMHVSMATPLEFADAEQRAAADELIRSVGKYRSHYIRPNGIKYIMDGSAAGQTAAMLDPFHGTSHRGDLRYKFDDVKADMAKYAPLGFGMKVHGIGDRAIRGTLDIYSQIPKGSFGTPHSVAHGTFIAPEDVKRFAEYGAVYEASPALWFPNDGVDVIRKDIGDRTENSWPIQPLVDANALVSYGSDWTVSLTPSPWPGLESMITREVAGGGEEKFIPAFAVSLETAIQIFTLNGAKAMGIAEQTGSIKVGKQADMIVLNQNLFEVDVYDLHKTEVVSTVFNGKEVFKR